MFKYTYELSYYITTDKDNIKPGWFGSDKGLTDCIITEKHINASTDSVEHELCMFFMYSSRSMLDITLGYRFPNGDNKPKRKFTIVVKIINTHCNLFDMNKYISNDLYIYLKQFCIGIDLYTNFEQNENEVKSYQELIYSKNKDILFKSNYINNVADYYLWIKKDKLLYLKYCRKIVSEIKYILGDSTIVEYDDIKGKNISSNKNDLISIVNELVRHIRIIINNSVSYEFNFQKINKIVSFDKYISYCLDNIDFTLKVEYNIDYKRIDTVQEINKLPQIIDSELILVQLCPFARNREKVKNLLEEVDKTFFIRNGDCNKLDLATICLILKEKCLMFNQELKTFSEFKEKICQYYGVEVPTHKKNKCTDRFKELYEGSLYGSFWNYHLRKNS